MATKYASNPTANPFELLSEDEIQTPTSSKPEKKAKPQSGAAPIEKAKRKDEKQKEKAPAPIEKQVKPQAPPKLSPDQWEEERKHAEQDGFHIAGIPPRRDRTDQKVPYDGAQQYQGRGDERGGRGELRGRGRRGRGDNQEFRGGGYRGGRGRFGGGDNLGRGGGEERGGYRGGRRGRGGRGRGEGEEQVYDKHSAMKTTKNEPPRKGGAGRGGWGADFESFADVVPTEGTWETAPVETANEDEWGAPNEHVADYTAPITEGDSGWSYEPKVQEDSNTSAEVKDVAPPELHEKTLEEYEEEKRRKQEELQAKIGVLQPRTVQKSDDLKGYENPHKQETKSHKEKSQKESGTTGRKGQKQLDASDLGFALPPKPDDDSSYRGRGRGGRGGRGNRGGRRGGRGGEGRGDNRGEGRSEGYGDGGGFRGSGRGRRGRGRSFEDSGSGHEDHQEKGGNRQSQQQHLNHQEFPALPQ